MGNLDVGTNWLVSINRYNNLNDLHFAKKNANKISIEQKVLTFYGDQYQQKLF